MKQHYCSHAASPDKPWGSERGVALVLTLIALALMSLLGLSLTYNATIDNAIAMNEETGTEAFYLAEAGVNHAVDIVLGTTDMSSFLRGADGDAATHGDNGIIDGSLVPNGHQAIPSTGVSLGNGAYTVQILDDDFETALAQLADYTWTSQIPLDVSESDPRFGLREDGDLYSDINGRILVRATGTAPNNSTTMIEAIVGPMSFPAILTEHDLMVSGDMIVEGTNGAVHTNNDLTISGNPEIEQFATASINLDVSGNPIVGGTLAGNQPLIDVPLITPQDFQSQADYILGSDGVVYDGAGNFLFDTSEGEEYGGWKRSSDSPVVWDLSGNTVFPGTYYVEGNAKVSGNPGDPGDPGEGIPPTPINFTVLAEASIEISGNPVIVPDLPGVMFIAGGDVKLNGNPDQYFGNGMVYAYEDIGISGNPPMKGNIMAYNGSSVHTLVDQNYVSGVPHIVYNRSTTGIPGLISWREIRN